MEVAALAEERTVEADRELIREGEPARYLYLVVSGQGRSGDVRFRGRNSS